MTIVMGLDQHRAQISAEWLDTESGEVLGPGSLRRTVRACVASLRAFVAVSWRSRWRATTGWRFVVEELRAIGAGVHLAEPAETAARRGNKSAPRAT